MKAVRTPMEYLHDDIQHDQIWYVLQQLHFDQLVAYEEAEVCQRATTQNTDVIYVPETNKTSMDYLAKILSTITRQVKLYTWRPAILRQEFNHVNIDIERIPEFIVDRFGGGAS
jgi:adenine-specific DNA-methyltransferase